MDERIVLRIALCVAVLGTSVLVFLEEPTTDPLYGNFVWSNGSRGLVELSDTVWVESQEPIVLSTNQCVRVVGVRTETQIAKALLGPVTQEELHYCP